ncbi:unnamed protein product [Acanthosepion pharaonis]|uniref:Uncharacterized protein n=1 Tax=Acanthosepion pharaonis TaxID=158019 RepID=A0A812CBL1_ACAPH|nr:unnamed protein product [Sepia pharaonis]
MVKSSTRPSDSGDSIKINVVQLSPNPPDGGWGWFVCLAAFYCNFIVIGLQMCFGLIYIGLRDTFYDSASKTSLSGALFSGFNMLIGPFVSGLLTFYSHRSIIIVSALVASAAMFISAFATRVEMLIVTYGLIGGISLGMVFFTANVIVGMYFVKRRALAFSLANCGAGAGMFTLNYAVTQLLEHYALRGTLMILSGLILNIVVFGALCRPVDCHIESSEETQDTKEQPASSQGLLSPKDRFEDLHLSKISLEEYRLTKRVRRISEMSHSSSTAAIDTAIMEANRRKESIRKSKIKEICSSFFDFSILKNPDILLLSMTYIFWSANQIPMVYLPAYLLSVGQSKDEAALLMSISGITCTIGQFLVGALVDFAHIASHYLLTLSLILLATLTFAVTLISAFWSFTVVVIFWSIALGFGISLRVIVTMDLTGMDDFSRGYSLLMLFNGIGYATSPPLSGK